MVFYLSKSTDVCKNLETDSRKGLTTDLVEKSRKKYGENKITKKKPKSLLKRIVEALLEPTLLILEFAWLITVGVNFGKFLKTGNGDIFECIGILIAILLSVVLTLYMEGKSAKAFEVLGKEYDNISVKVIRNGKIEVVSKSEVVVGDILIVETGDKVVADGRILECADLSVDESTLTGESNAVNKQANELTGEVPLAERNNMLYSGTFVSQGFAKIVVTAVGDRAELGKIATSLGEEKTVAPLNEKLNKLGKQITIIGILSASFAFILSIVRLSILGEIDFFTVQDAFIDGIVLIVAAVPEGLPTTAAISLTLNVVKLAKSNALIRKLVSAETVGCVSVICSDKTGTLTENKMTVEKVVYKSLNKDNLIVNALCNSTAEYKDGKIIGQATEGAVIKYYKDYDYTKLRNNRLILEVLPFNSSNKYMATKYMLNNTETVFIKGAPEIICGLSNEKNAINDIYAHQREGKRVIAFASKVTKGNIEEEINKGNFTFDGYAVISDPLRKDVYKSVIECENAGIEVKIMTGDNIATATSIGYTLGLIKSDAQVVNADYIDGLSDEKLEKEIANIKVIARSTPITKLKVVDALKRLGEVVAVTGDGVNDAPAIKKADIGIAMGSGSEITKEASDIVLLDDSFSTIVKAISFGRNIYKNFQRFITFQLSVNFTSIVVVITSLILGLKNPFNAVQLLWIDIIMDGPPALTLGLEQGGKTMKNKPVKRKDGIVNKSMIFQIGANGLLMSGLIILEYLFDFLKVGVVKMPTAIFCLFVIFQLFNAFNCRKIGSESIFSSIGSNKLMVWVFFGTFVLQILITQVLCGFFKTVPLDFVSWIKIILTASSVVLISEGYKLIYRTFKKENNLKKSALLKLKF